MFHVVTLIEHLYFTDCGNANSLLCMYYQDHQVPMAT